MSDVYKVIDQDAAELKQQLKWEKERLKHMKKVSGVRDVDGSMGPCKIPPPESKILLFKVIVSRDLKHASIKICIKVNHMVYTKSHNVILNVFNVISIFNFFLIQHLLVKIYFVISKNL